MGEDCETQRTRENEKQMKKEKARKQMKNIRQEEI